MSLNSCFKRVQRFQIANVHAFLLKIHVNIILLGKLMWRAQLSNPNATLHRTKEINQQQMTQTFKSCLGFEIETQTEIKINVTPCNYGLFVVILHKV